LFWNNGISIHEIKVFKKILKFTPQKPLLAIKPYFFRTYSQRSPKSPASHARYKKLSHNETRKYVKNVLRNYAICKYLYDNKSFKRFEDVLPIRNESFFILHGKIK